MPCFSPLKGYRARDPNPKTGRYSLVFKAHQGDILSPLDIPCGQCIGCRLEKSRQWAIRCTHEASLHQFNSFITLTYRPEDFPPDGSLDMKHYQDFMKRLRFHVADEGSEYRDKFLTETDKGVRFFHCGEYGENFGRPHYHACLFNLDFKDKVVHSKGPCGNNYYKSDTLSEIWGKGHCLIGEVNFETAAYVARYITKKVTGSAALDHYVDYDKRTGEIIRDRKPEYTTMSRRPGIGKGWFDKFTSDVYPSDQVVIRGKVMRPPKYYDAQFEILDPDQFLILKKKRSDAALAAQLKEYPPLKPPYVYKGVVDPLWVKSEIQNIRFKLLKRGYENEG